MYSVDIHVVDIFGILLAVFMLGFMFGRGRKSSHIAKAADRVNSHLLNENMLLKIHAKNHNKPEVIPNADPNTFNPS